MVDRPITQPRHALATVETSVSRAIAPFLLTASTESRTEPRYAKGGQP